MKNGNKISVKGKDSEEILNEKQCAVLLDKHKRRVYLWRGSSSGTKDRFAAAHLAENLNSREFGGAGKIVQNDKTIKDSASSATIEDMSRSKIRSIGI